MSTHESLFQPLRVGPLELKNRVIFGPHTTEFGRDGLPTSRHTAYYAERARGGVGMIVTESSYVHKSSLSKANSVLSCDPAVVTPLIRIADAVHIHDVPVVGQLSHRGRQMTGAHSQLPVWGVSPLPCPSNREVPHEIDEREIDELVWGYAAAASHYRQAGYDGVEIHAAHGYLIEQFWSPWTNKRADCYGGTLQNRLRFSRRVIEAVRANCAPTMAVGIRVSADELVTDGLHPGDIIAILKELTAGGGIDYVSVSIGTHSTVNVMIGDMSLPQGHAVPLAANIKRALSIPVFVGLRIKEPDMAADIVASGAADAVVMVRSLIADPQWPAKVAVGTPETIRHCVGANQDCRNHHRGAAIGCLQNPAAGREEQLGIGTMVSAAEPKRVLVVGAGPGGMEAARVCALRGHRVTLAERDHHVGGQVNLAVAAESRRELGDVTRYLVPQLKLLDVEVRCETEVTVDNIDGFGADEVVMAVGSTPAPPAVRVDDGADVEFRDVRQVLAGAPVADGHVVIYDPVEGFWQGCSVAEWLSARGYRVSIVTPHLQVGIELPKESLRPTYARLLRASVTFTPMTRIVRVDGGRLYTENVYTKAQGVVDDCRTLVTTGSVSDTALVTAMRARFPDVPIHAIGDVVAPRRITHAIREGHLIGRKI